MANKSFYTPGLKKFGRDTPEDWTCLCDTFNKAYLVKCDMCGLKRDYVVECRKQMKKDA